MNDNSIVPGLFRVDSGLIPSMENVNFFCLESPRVFSHELASNCHVGTGEAQERLVSPYAGFSGAKRGNMVGMI